MFITSWTIDIRMNIQIWLLYRRYKSEWYNFWWATIQDIAACACKVWTLFDQACGQEECSQTTTTMTTTTMTTDKSGLHRLATDILSWAKKLSSCVVLTIDFWYYSSGKEGPTNLLDFTISPIQLNNVDNEIKKKALLPRWYRGNPISLYSRKPLRQTPRGRCWTTGPRSPEL